MTIKRRITIDRVSGQDAFTIALFEDHEDYFGNHVKTRVLTESGWLDLENGYKLPDNLPVITGQDLLRGNQHGGLGIIARAAGYIEKPKLQSFENPLIESRESERVDL